MRQVLLALAGVQFVTGIWLAVAPGNFVDTIAPFGDAPDHFLRDISTFYLALGVALLLSVSRRSWRVPVLFLAALQYAIHTLNHLLDIGGTDPAWLGYFNFAALAGFTVALGWVLAAAARGEQR
jgi:uncharacterized protein YjeT (DUF2065 family)